MGQTFHFIKNLKFTLQRIFHRINNIIMNNIPKITNVDAGISDGVLVVNWEAEKFGFGQLYVSWDNMRDRIKIDAETLDREMVAAILAKIADKAILDSDSESTMEVLTATPEELEEIFPRGSVDSAYVQYPFYSDTTPLDATDTFEIELRYNALDNKVICVRYEIHTRVPLNESVNTLIDHINTNGFAHPHLVHSQIWSWK
ncbi:MAG: hypothetical protein QXN55_00510 [Candidatus Nitrosotenuis sp.]